MPPAGALEWVLAFYGPACRLFSWLLIDKVSIWLAATATARVR